MNENDAMQWIKYGKRWVIIIWATRIVGLLMLACLYAIDPQSLVGVFTSGVAPETVPVVKAFAGVTFATVFCALVTVFVQIYVAAILGEQLVIHYKWISIVSSGSRIVFVPKSDWEKRLVLPLNKKTLWIKHVVIWLLLWPWMIRELTFSGERPTLIVRSAVLDDPSVVQYDFRFEWLSYELAIELGVNDRRLADAIADAVAEAGAEHTVPIEIDGRTIGCGFVTCELAYDGP